MKTIIFILTVMLVGIGFGNFAEARTRHHHHHGHYVSHIHHGHVRLVNEQPIYYSSDNDINSFFMHENPKSVDLKKGAKKVGKFINNTVKAGGNWIAKASQFIGLRASQLGLPSRLWCADFANKITHSGSDRTAKSYLHRGRPAPYGCTNCWAISNRKGGGHVGVVKGYDYHGNPIEISGNYGHKVGVGAHNKNTIIAYRYL